MTVAQQLACLGPHTPPKLAMQNKTLGKPGRGQVLVQVQAASVNPIDVKRAQGYGRRILRLKGAARFPLVLGNDLAGVVAAVGPGSDAFKPGDRVYGLVPTGPQGAHASHVLADASLLRAAPAQLSMAQLAALPYTFTTLWLALKAVGLDEVSAQHKAVLVHGASGGLGQLALQVLARWGARVTAVCSTPHVQTCLDLGAHEVLDRLVRPVTSLPRQFDASLNFAAWADEASLLGCLKPNAMGHATTVHPLLASFDEGGWVRGGIHAYQAWSNMRKRAAALGAATRYAWVVFQPSTQALDALAHGLSVGRLHLPIGLTASLSQGTMAFEHVAQQRQGRAILLPE
jgi:NADPH:quinone reductase-like Zn-dependent oxidoreductase